MKTTHWLAGCVLAVALLAGVALVPMSADASHRDYDYDRHERYDRDWDDRYCSWGCGNSYYYDYPSYYYPQHSYYQPASYYYPTYPVYYQQPAAYSYSYSYSGGGYPYWSW